MMEQSVFVVTKNAWTGAAYDGWVESMFGVYTDKALAKKACVKDFGDKLKWYWDKDDKTWNTGNGGWLDDMYTIKECPLNVALVSEGEYA